jgi:ribonuclease HI
MLPRAREEESKTHPDSNHTNNETKERQMKSNTITEGVTRTLKQKKKKHGNNDENNNAAKYSEELRSRFGEAFLPFAYELESIERKRTDNKRRGKHRKTNPKRITMASRETKKGENRKQCLKKLRSDNKKKIQQKLSKSTKKTHTNDHLNWIGDAMTYDDAWPNTDQRKTIRIFSINLNGVTYQNDFLEWEMVVAFLMDMQVDVFGLTEINLDLNKGVIRDKLIQAGRHFDPYLRIITSSSQQQVGNTPFKMGGTVTGTNGCWSGRITTNGTDKLGRWTYMRMQAKHGKQVVFITIYVPRKPSQEGQGTTIYSQMESDLLKVKGKLCDPRKELLNDMHRFISNENKSGHTVFLLGDVNDDLGITTGQMGNFLESVRMKMTFEKRHGDTINLPPTHDRGVKCIDLLGCSEHIPDSAIVRAGFAPFYYNFFTDHRGVFVDIDIDTIFNCKRPDTTKQIFKRFTTRQVPKCNRYLHKLEELFDMAKINEQVDELEIQLIESTKAGETVLTQKAITKTKILFKTVTDFMICAEKKAGPLPYRDGFPDSPKLRQAAFRVIRLKKYLRLVSLGTLEAKPGEKECVIKDLKSAQIQLRLNQKSANLLRQHHLEILADKRSHQWRMSSAEALHIINESEKSKQMHTRHRRFLQSSNEGTLRSLMVPAPITGLKNNIKDHRTYTNITDSNLMFNFLLKRNFDHLMQSENSMFTNGQILNECGWYGEEEGMEKLLQGTLNAEEIKTEYPQFGQEGVEFIKALRYAKDKDGKVVETFQWKFGVEEYLEVFNKTNESTACGPSGIHMSHWKAACERPNIARVHAYFMWAAFEFGFSYPRWEQSWHCMIKKLQQPLLPKLRIVQLFEGDFNAGLKYLIGRKMMKHMNNQDLHDPETFGSRTGKTAPEALLNLQLLFDHNRIWRLPTAILFNDAIGCYDRIVPTLCELAMRARGCPKGIAKCHTITQKKMIHRIRIATGISEGTISFALEHMTEVTGKTLTKIQGRTGGIGQGGGAGPLSWIAVIDIMLEAYRKLRPGAEALDPLQLYSICYWMISYVDDNTIVMGFQEETSQNTILTTIRENLGSWRRLLQLTGGDIDVSKSKWCTMRWSYCKNWGSARLETAKEFPGKIGMTNIVQGNKVEQVLGRLEPDQAERVLGVRLPLDGNMKEELNYRCQQMRAFSKKVYNAPINHWDAWIIYESRYRAMIRYPLPVTMFTREQCIKIQRPFVHAILPKLGLNRNTPRAIIFGPKSLGGLQLMDLRVEQIAVQWDTTRAHIRRLDRAGKGLYITAHDMQVQLGTSTPFYDHSPVDYYYTTTGTRWHYLWSRLRELNLKIEIYNFWTPTLSYQNDRNIMDTAMKDRLILSSKWKLLIHINQCRLYVKAINLSDLTRDGKNLYKPYMDGTERGSNNLLEIPDIRRPTDNQWRVWKAFLYRNFLSPGVSINPPLGEKVSVEIGKRQLPRSEIDIYLGKNLSSETSFDELKKNLGPTLSLLLGKVIMPEDEGLGISEAIVEGVCTGGSDGSLCPTFRNKRGAFGYLLRGTKDQGVIEGFGAAPNSDTMSSTTTESYGLIGVLILLHIICIKYQLCSEECFGAVKIYIDNKIVVERGNTTQELINLSDYNIPDQDLWTMITDLRKRLPIKVNIEWIKGHQDENKFGKRKYGPFTNEVSINIRADELAKMGMQLGEQECVKRPNMSTTVLSLYDSDNKYISDVRRYITETINGARMMEYMQEKRGWNDQVVESIEWEGLEATVTKANPIRRTRLLKMLHNWQNTGKQKRLFRDSRLKMESDNPLAPTAEEIKCELCPEGCNEEEVAMHFTNCPVAHSIRARSDLIRKVLRRLKAMRTYEGIISTVGSILKDISTRKTIMIEQLVDRKDGKMSLNKALRGQETIGWNEFCQGYVHKEWARVQQIHYSRNGIRSHALSIESWKKKFTTTLLEYSMDCWNRRNETLHGKEIEETRKIRLERVQKMVKELYKHRSEVKGTKYYRIFRMAIKKRIKLGIQTNTIWIGLAEEALRQYREKVAKNTLNNWLIPI